jgi:hypothetical protein
MGAAIVAKGFSSVKRWIRDTVVDLMVGAAACRGKIGTVAKK